MQDISQTPTILPTQESNLNDEIDIIFTDNVLDNYDIKMPNFYYDTISKGNDFSKD